MTVNVRAIDRPVAETERRGYRPATINRKLPALSRVPGFALGLAQQRGVHPRPLDLAPTYGLIRVCHGVWS